MDFFYTIHAEEKIKERKLDKSIIEEVIQNPETLLILKFGRKIAQKKTKGKSLLVIYEEKQSVYIIITAYYTELGRYK